MKQLKNLKHPKNIKRIITTLYVIHSSVFLAYVVATAFQWFKGEAFIFVENPLIFIMLFLTPFLFLNYVHIRLKAKTALTDQLFKNAKQLYANNHKIHRPGLFLYQRVFDSYKRAVKVDFIKYGGFPATMEDFKDFWNNCENGMFMICLLYELDINNKRKTVLTIAESISMLRYAMGDKYSITMLHAALDYGRGHIPFKRFTDILESAPKADMSCLEKEIPKNKKCVTEEMIDNYARYILKSSTLILQMPSTINRLFHLAILDRLYHGSGFHSIECRLILTSNSIANACRKTASEEVFKIMDYFYKRNKGKMPYTEGLPYKPLNTNTCIGSDTDSDIDSDIDTSNHR